MKRTYNNVALETILFTIPGNVKIIVEDWEEGKIHWTDVPENNPVSVWEGLVKDFKMSGGNWKQSRSKVYHTEIRGDAILFRISTQFEEY